MNRRAKAMPEVGVHSSRSEGTAMGKRLRRKVPRSTHAAVNLAKKVRDPVAMLIQSDRDRIAALVPIRYQRMLQSPFAFFRGSAAIMAFDLASTPVTGIHVQACGDCHLMNFGAFATPERRVIFDINDFDETHPAPWEWDIKRLAASIMVAARYRGFADAQCLEAVHTAVRAYRQHLADYAGRSRQEVWYSRIDAEALVAKASGPHRTTKTARSPNAVSSPQQLPGDASNAGNVSARLLPKLTEMIDGKRRIKDDPPLVYHVRRQRAFFDYVRTAIVRYHQSLPTDRRALVDRYEPIDVAMKVVGVGSVGTFCAVALLQADVDDPLFLQIKQARASVLEPYTEKSVYRNQGERVVIGQRMMQSASDMFLGWSELGKPPIDCYFRQLRDTKMSVNLDALSFAGLVNYAFYCGWATARAHAKTGNSAVISGYLGAGDAFDRALGHFAGAYANQTERDYAALVKAAKSGRIRAAIR
jgi:uncharacterized protein (DUF2252 family)